MMPDGVRRRAAHQYVLPSDFFYGHNRAPSTMCARYRTTGNPRTSRRLPPSAPASRSFRNRRIVKGRSADPQQTALRRDRQAVVSRFDHRPPPFHAHRPEAFAKKSRSTTSCPILACSLFHLAVAGSPGCIASPGECACHPVDGLSLPGCDHRVVNTVRCGQLRQRQIPRIAPPCHLALKSAL